MLTGGVTAGAGEGAGVGAGKGRLGSVVVHAVMASATAPSETSKL